MIGSSKLRATCGTVCLLAGTIATAQPAPDAAKADEAYQAEQWAEAAEAYETIAGVEPSNARAWFRLGVSRRETGEYAAAIEAFEQARSAGVPPSLIDYEIVKARAQNGEEDAAYAALEATVAAGFANYQGLESDEALAGLRSRPGFAALVDRTKRNAMPCEYDPKHREFDFWIGEWDVADASGTPQGENSITKQESGCVLVEKWTSLGGSGGMSINFYDPGMQQWVQQWVSANGGFINIVGGVEDGSMVLVGTINGPGQAAPRLPFRGTWTPLDDGRVRQFFEQSNDGGKTWAPWFEGFYARKSAE
ncbi:MAG: tetratricopeptide repeat protein [Gammaproteobacteria bacterium]|nr:tetratricopeptide repeat protein [Gammaproteobacteria bacterium]